MTVTDITNDIRKETGTAFPNLNQLAKYFKMDNSNVAKFLDGLDTWEQGRQHKYFAKDVAERIIKNRIRGS